MYDIETTEEFDKWLTSIRDGITQKVIQNEYESCLLERLVTYILLMMVFSKPEFIMVLDIDFILLIRHQESSSCFVAVISQLRNEIFQEPENWSRSYHETSFHVRLYIAAI